MANLLTAQEAANFIRCDVTDPIMLMLLPLVDKFVERATGRNWTEDTTIHPIAKLVAGMLTVMFYDNPSQIDASRATVLPLGAIAAFGQLEAEALRYRKYEFRGISAVGSISLPGARMGDQVISLVGVYGVTGNQSSSFESAIRYDGSIEQLTNSDLFWNRYVVIIKSPGDDIIA